MQADPSSFSFREPHTPFLQHTRYAIAGGGRSGIAAARLLLALGKDVVLHDDGADVNAPEYQALAAQGVALRFGKADGSADLADDRDALVVSPGVALTHPLLCAARERGLPARGELELGWLCSGKARVAAVTGTNGKTTVTMLLEAIFAAAGKRSVAAGNIGLPLCEAVLQAGPQIDETWFALEVSSFQLETTERFRPDVALILNVTPDHLDRHVTMEEYTRLKGRIAERQTQADTLVINQDDALCLKLGMEARDRVRVRRFALIRPVPDGAWLEEDGLMIRPEGVKPHRLMTIDQIQMVGMHNIANALAAAAAAEALGIPRKQIAAALAAFKAAPHRMERVATVAGVDYINDSKATNLDAMVKALESFSGGVHLIAGGRDKASPFATITALVARAVTRVYLIGEAAATIRTAWGSDIECLDCGTLENAIAQAAARAAEGETVLLSPGCASYDQFKNYMQRGDEFARLVHAREPATNPA